MISPVGRDSAAGDEAVSPEIEASPVPESQVPDGAGRAYQTARGGRAVLRWLDIICQAVCVVAITASCLLIFASVVDRAITGSSILWANDGAEFAVGVIAIFGGVCAYCQKEHLGLESVIKRVVGVRVQAELDGAVGVAVAVCGALVGWYATVMMTTPGLGTFGSLQLPTEILYAPLAVGGSLLTLAAIADLAARADSRFPFFGTAVVCVIVVVFWIYSGPLRNWWGGNEGRPLIVAFVVIAVAVCIGAPIAFALAFGTSIGIFLNGQLDMNQIPLQMTNITQNLALIALPFFILAGAFLGTGDIPTRLMSFVRRLGGGGRGSEGIAAVIGMYIFSGLSGSKMGDIAAVSPGLVGSVRRPRDITGSGAPRPLPDPHREEIAGILSSAAVMGEAVPPSITMLVLGSVTTISTEGLFAAGLIPAAFIGLCIAVVAVIRAKRLRGAPEEDRRVSFLRAALRATPPLLCILIIAVGIIGGYATPSEASSLAAVYCGVLIFVFYRMGIRRLLRAISVAARLAGILLFMIAITGALSWFLTLSGLTADVQNLVTLTGNNKLAFMAFTVVALIILGSIFEGMPALLIFAPILVPDAIALGINPLQYGVVLLLAMGVGNFMPPIGICFYATNAIVGADSGRTWRANLTYLGSVVIGVFILAFVPGICTALPNLLHIN